MRVTLAGYNIDASVLEDARQAGVSPIRLTPEVLSAAYARISRDPRPVGELRAIAVEEVEKARSSNRKIIFEMGHHSVAEHAVFNFDVLGISRLAIEWLEHFRLCSFTEKSQRYITLDHDFVIPEEVGGTSYEAELLSLISAQTEIYGRLHTLLRDHLGTHRMDLSRTRAGRRLLDGWAKEDARYVTLLATTGQLGMTANARNLEHIIRRFRAAELREVRRLGEILFESVAEVAPSLLLFTEAAPFDVETSGALRQRATSIRGESTTVPDAGAAAVNLVRSTRNADRLVGAAMMFVVTGGSFSEWLERVEGCDDRQLRDLFQIAFERMEFYDAPLREFEHVSFTFELMLSSSAYAQLKRHRMSTQSVQDYDASLGVTIPPAVEEIGLRDDFLRHVERCEHLFLTMRREIPAAATYVLTNAHRRRVLITMNLRELYHFIRLRDDGHAQWDIRNLAEEMRRQAALVMPLGSLLLCGKDEYPSAYQDVFGRPPRVLPPGA